MSAVVPRQNTLGSRETGGQDGNGEPADGKSLLAARVRLNAVAQWHSRWECPWMKHGETAGTGGDENMKGVGIVWVPTRDVYASDFGHMNNLKPLPNHHHRANNWAPVNHEFDWICRIDSPPNMEFFWLKRHATHSISIAFKNKSDYQIKHGQNRYVVFGVWLSSAIHGGLKVTDGHVHE